MVFPCPQGNINRYVPPEVLVDSIQVYDLPGSPALVYVDWQSTHSVELRAGGMLYHYAVFAQGDANTLFLKGMGFLSVGSGRIYYQGEGEYDLTYTNNIISITEQWKGFAGGVYYWDAGVAEEKIVSRTFHIQPQSLTPLTCEERLRTLNTTANEQEQLDAVAWTQRVSSPGDDPDLCAAINPKRCVLAGSCTRD